MLPYPCVHMPQYTGNPPGFLPCFFGMPMPQTRTYSHYLHGMKTTSRSNRLLWTLALQCAGVTVRGMWVRGGGARARATGWARV
jgi:hypothetical protein